MPGGELHTCILKIKRTEQKVLVNLAAGDVCSPLEEDTPSAGSSHMVPGGLTGEVLLNTTFII